MRLKGLLSKKELYLLYPWVLAGFVLRMWRVSLQLVMFRDETTYAYQIRHILEGTIFSDATYYTFPPAYPLLAAPVAALTGNPEFAGRLISALAGCCAAIPAFYLARDLFGRRAAAVAGALVAMFPPLMGIGVMSEPTYSFFIVLSLYLGNRANSRRSYLSFALFGLSMAAAYLSRPEGLFIFVPCLALFFILILKDIGLRKASALCAAGVIGFMVLAFPYMLQLRAHFGAWEISGKTRINLAKVKARETYTPGVNPERHEAEVYEGLDKKKMSLGENVLNEMGAIVNRYPGNFKQELESLPKAAGYPLIIACLIGAAMLLPRPEGLRKALMLVCAFTPMLVIPMVFVLDRILVPYLPVVIILAAYAVSETAAMIAASAKEYAPRAGGAAGAGICAAFLGAALMAGNFGSIIPETDTSKVLAQDQGYNYYYILRQVAEFTKQYIPPGSRIITRNNIYAYYAGGEYSSIPVEDIGGLIKYAKEQNCKYLMYGPMEQEMRPELMPYIFRNGTPVNDPAPGMRLVFAYSGFLLYEFQD